MADIILPDNEIWTKSLKNIPRFSSVTIAKHLEKCGKSCVGEKGYKFFVENYIHDILVRENKRKSLHVIKGRCHRSQRKNKALHTMQITVKSVNERADVSKARCSCKAGYVFVIFSLY